MYLCALNCFYALTRVYATQNRERKLTNLKCQNGTSSWGDDHYITEQKDTISKVPIKNNLDETSK